jgi:hypothetical protein
MLEYERSPRLMAHLAGTTNQSKWNHPAETSSVLHQLLCHREMNEHFEVSVLITHSNAEIGWIMCIHESEIGESQNKL